MADCLEVVEEGGYVGVLLLVSLAVIVASFSWRRRTMRYASLRNSSAVSVDGRRDVGGGMVLDECFSVSRVFMVGVRSVIAVNFNVKIVGGGVDVLLSTSGCPSCVVGLLRLPHCPPHLRLRTMSNENNSFEMLEHT